MKATKNMSTFRTFAVFAFTYGPDGKLNLNALEHVDQAGLWLRVRATDRPVQVLIAPELPTSEVVAALRHVADEIERFHQPTIRQKQYDAEALKFREMAAGAQEIVDAQQAAHETSLAEMRKWP